MEAALVKVPGRSEVTTRTYLCRLRKAMEITSKPSARAMLADHKASLAALDAHYAHPTTYKLVLAAVGALIAANGKWAEANPAAAGAWKAALRDARTDPRKTTDLEGVRHKFACFEEVEAARRKLAAAGPNRGDLNKSLTHLLLVFFTLVPPKRADYNALRVLTSEPRTDPGNYVLVRPGRPVCLVMHEFKTSGATEGPFRERLVPEAAAALCASLKAHPRNHVFVGRDGGPMSPSAFSQFVIRRTTLALGKPVGVTQLRHAYVTALYEGNASIADKRIAAESMQHSVATQKTYVVTRPDGGRVCRLTKPPAAARKGPRAPRPS
jgi:hypothetical protein